MEAAMEERSKINNLEQHIMLAVLIIGDTACATAVQKCIEKRCNFTVNLGTLHSSLNVLHRKGLISSRVKQSRSASDHIRAKRFYQVTDEGIGCLNRAKQIIDKMWEGTFLADCR